MNCILKHIFFIYFFSVFISSFSQEAQIHGSITSNGINLPFVQVAWSANNNPNVFSQTDVNGNFRIVGLPVDTINIQFSHIGFITKNRTVIISSPDEILSIEDSLIANIIDFDEVIITGTRTNRRKTETPVIVNLIDNITLENVAACNISDGLLFQPGLRVETNCQTCNYTQLRINGLSGGYSQILINGRPTFSPLTSLYGLEQIPVNMIDRVEIVRGGGSALYGSSAIAGTVNVLTKMPEFNSFDISSRYSLINGQSSDVLTMGNATIINENGKSGLALYFNNRKREYYDHNGDNFSELPSIDLSSFGGTFFLRPIINHKLEVSFSNMIENRYGGEMILDSAHIAQQSEDRSHDVFIGNIDYEITSRDNHSSFIFYCSGQNTNRDHYTGIHPDNEDELSIFMSNPPYGGSLTTTYQSGIQANHTAQEFPLGKNTITLGGEYLFNEVLDSIPIYNYFVDQKTRNLGVFLQSDWSIHEKINILSGFRFDTHNLLDNSIISPRISFMYTPQKYTQFRFSWGRGFRAPQAFDTDLHMAFAGGGISRITLSPNLIEERSDSYTASFNYDRPGLVSIFGVTLELFLTNLKNVFFLSPQGSDEVGQLFEKQNGDGAIVQGVTFEGRCNYNGKLQLDFGVTLQTSEYNTSVDVIEGLPPTNQFLRTPSNYGYSTITYTPSNKWNTTLNIVYTGSMLVPHFAGAPEQDIDELFTTNNFMDIGIRNSHTLHQESDKSIELFFGLKNILNAYQNDFDTGKNRDSNYIYGPSMPRTLFAGIRFRSI